MECDSSFVCFLFKFSDSYDFTFSALPQTFLSKEPLETLNSSTTIDFLVSVHISNLFFIISLFECFCGWGLLLGFAKVFNSHFHRFCHLWDVKPPGGFFSSFDGFVSTFSS